MTAEEEHWRDVATLEALGQIREPDPEFPEATPCLRLELTSDCNLSALPGRLDDILARAFDLIAPELTFFGAEALWAHDETMKQRPFGFAESRGRKPRVADRDALAHLSALMAGAEAASLAERQRQFTRLQAAGLDPAPEDFAGSQDGGSLILSDAFPSHLSGSHIMLAGSMPWRVSLSFSLSCWRRHHHAILALAGDLARTGAFDSGCFGFALNTGETTLPETAVTRLRPVSDRFRMITIGNPLAMMLTDRLEDRRWGKARWLYPPGAWSFIAKARLGRYGIAESDLRGLAGQVAAVEESENAFLVKLWDWPILGDVNWNADLAPAHVLARAVAPALEKAGREGSAVQAFGGLALGFEADILIWYHRFLRGEP